ncbi:MAG: hypothetical protein JSU97_04300, partial [Dehalococcoidia bacterium]
PAGFFPFDIQTIGGDYTQPSSGTPWFPPAKEAGPVTLDLHFQTAEYGLTEPAGDSQRYTRFFEIHCYDVGDYVFRFCNRADVKYDTDPVPDNNLLCEDLTVHTLHSADIKVLSFFPDPWATSYQFMPSTYNVINLIEDKHNNGPQDAWSSVFWTILPIEDRDLDGIPDINVRWEAQIGDMCTYQGLPVACGEGDGPGSGGSGDGNPSLTGDNCQDDIDNDGDGTCDITGCTAYPGMPDPDCGDVDDIQFAVYLPVSTFEMVSRPLKLHCKVEDPIPYTLTLFNDEWPFNPENPDEWWVDPDPMNNSQVLDLDVICASPHYKAYDIWDAGAPPVGYVDLEDQFGTQSADVDVPRWLMAPAIKYDPTTDDYLGGSLAATHLKCYDIVGGHDPPDLVNLTTQFGTHAGAEVGPAVGLCIPAAKAISPDLPIEPPGMSPHYVVYELPPIQETPATVDVETQFGTETNYPFYPQLLLAPALKWGMGDLNAPHLLCYSIQYGHDPPESVNMDSQFGPETDVAVGPALKLCVPAEKEIVLLEADSVVTEAGYDDLGQDYDPGTPELDILKSSNITIDIYSIEHNYGPGDANSEITFLADIPLGCEGQWLNETHTMRTYTPGNPMEQDVGSGPTPTKDPGDGVAGTAESVVESGVFPEPVSVPISVTEPFELHCYEPGLHTFTFCNKQEVLPPEVDPDLTNSFQCFDLVVNSIHNADIKVLSFFSDPPGPFQFVPSTYNVINLIEDKHNNGPQDAWSSVWWYMDAIEDRDLDGIPDINVRWEAQIGDLCTYLGGPVPCGEGDGPGSGGSGDGNPSLTGDNCQDDIDNDGDGTCDITGCTAHPGMPDPDCQVDIGEIQFAVWLPVSSPELVERPLKLHCKVEDPLPYTLTLHNEEFPFNPDDPDEFWVDPNLDNNWQHLDLDVTCASPHYRSYLIWPEAPVGETVNLETQFGTQSVQVDYPQSLKAPAIKYDTASGDYLGGGLAAPHLKCYNILQGHDPPDIVSFASQFRTHVGLNVGQALEVCVPALKGIYPDPPVGELPTAPHYVVYSLVASPGPVSTVDVETQFGLEPGLEAEYAYRLLAPALKNGEGDLNAPHLLCYDLWGDAPPVSVNLETQFGTETAVDVLGAHQLCVPAEQIWPEADVKILDQRILDETCTGPPPTEIPVSQDVYICVERDLHNNGDYGPVQVSISDTATAPPGCTINPGLPGGATLDVSVDVTDQRLFTIHCDEASTHGPFTIDTTISVTTPTVTDPDLTNNSASSMMTVDALGEVDVKITDQEPLNATCDGPPPTEIDVSEDAVICLRKHLHNNGPGAGVVNVRLDKDAYALYPGAEILPATATDQVALPMSVPTTHDELFTIHCYEPSTHWFVVENWASVKDAHVSDPNGAYHMEWISVDCLASSDIKITSQAFLSPPSQITVGVPQVVTLRKQLHNNGPYGPVTVYIAKSAYTDSPNATIAPPTATAQVDLAESNTVTHDEDFTISCSAPGTYTYTVDNDVTSKDPHISGSAFASTDLIVECVAAEVDLAKNDLYVKPFYCGDSDRDGLEDYGAADGTTPGTGDCCDNADNDGDTLTDGQDPDCQPYINEDPVNGTDDDGDVLFDEDPPLWPSHQTCPWDGDDDCDLEVDEDPKNNADDDADTLVDEDPANGFMGIDNDRDGWVDEDGSGRFDWDGDTTIDEVQLEGVDDDADTQVDEDPLDSPVGEPLLAHEPHYLVKELLQNLGPTASVTADVTTELDAPAWRADALEDGYTTCNDALDNDGDGNCDTMADACWAGSAPDPQCLNEHIGEEESGLHSCNDGLDNGSVLEPVPDGLIDELDPDCETLTEVSVECEDAGDRITVADGVPWYIKPRSDNPVLDGHPDCGQYYDPAHSNKCVPCKIYQGVGPVDATCEGLVWGPGECIAVDSVPEVYKELDEHQQVDLPYQRYNLHLEVPPDIWDPVILGNPIGSAWRELYPTYSPPPAFNWILTSWADNGDGILSASDDIDMTDALDEKTYFHVDEVTETVCLDDPLLLGLEMLCIEPMGAASIYDPYAGPWHQKWPEMSLDCTFLGWVDNGDGYLSECDTITLDCPNTGVHDWHVLDVAIDIWASEKVLKEHQFDLSCEGEVGEHKFIIQNEVQPAVGSDPNQGDNELEMELLVECRSCQTGIDSDGDTFKDDVECYLPTDPTDDCTDVVGMHDAWPLDINMDTFVTVVGDVLAYSGRIGAGGGPPPSPTWMRRLDLNMDNFITVVGDVLLYSGKIGAGC